jgi:hypothetical protein
LILRKEQADDVAHHLGHNIRKGSQSNPDNDPIEVEGNFEIRSLPNIFRGIV